MAKYRIAWMPGDGVGNDVMEAARIVLDRMKFDAEYVPCDIGWEFWCTEGNALPDRTVKALTVRVVLSITLFALLMLGFYFGIIPKQGL